MSHQVFSFPLFAIVQESEGVFGPAVTETPGGMALVLFTTLEKAESFAFDYADSDVFEIENESSIGAAFDALPDVLLVILDPKDRAGFVVSVQEFIESIRSGSYKLN